MDSELDRTHPLIDGPNEEFEAWLDETMRDSDAERAEAERLYWLRRGLVRTHSYQHGTYEGQDEF